MYHTSTHFTHGRSRGAGVVLILICFRLYKKSEATHADTPTVERDFNACGNLLFPNRSRIDTCWVEIVMFVKVLPTEL